MEEDAVLHVYAVEDEWLLVRIDGGDDRLGFVPKNYCEALDDADEVEVAGAAESAADVEAQRAAEEEAERNRAREARLRELRLQDSVESWAITKVDGQKKDEGTLGIGNGAIFFISGKVCTFVEHH